MLYLRYISRYFEKIYINKCRLNLIDMLETTIIHTYYISDLIWIEFFP
uniref:Uncharacterized protein n=1 Tax=Rhizophora mucronata TaxID=61149 RepID=A0A2P2PED0_RHIMU